MAREYVRFPIYTFTQVILISYFLYRAPHFFQAEIIRKEHKLNNTLMKFKICFSRTTRPILIKIWHKVSLDEDNSNVQLNDPLFSKGEITKDRKFSNKIKKSQPNLAQSILRERY